MNLRMKNSLQYWKSAELDEARGKGIERKKKRATRNSFTAIEN